MMRRSYDRFRFYISVLVCFLAFVTIFFATFAFVYYRTTVDMKSNAIGESLSFMQRGAGEIADSFLGLYGDLTTVQTMDEFSALARVGLGGLEPPGYGQLLRLQQRLKEICALDDTITDVMLFFDAEDSFAVSPLYVLHEFESTYESGQFRCGELGYDQFVTLIRQYANSYVDMNIFTPAYSFTSNFPSIAATPLGSKIMFVYRFNIAYKKCDTYGILFLDTDAIHEKLAVGEKGFFAIAGGDSVLYATDASAAVPTAMDDTLYDGDGRTTWIRASSPRTAVSYYTAIDDREIIGQISSFTMLLHILLAVFAVLSVAVLLLLALYVVNPLQKLFNRMSLSGPRAGGNIIRHISREIDAISDDNRQISSKLSRWTPILRSNLLGRLLRGEYLRDEERDLMASLLGICGGECPWQAAVVGPVGARSPAADDGLPGDAIRRHIPGAILHATGGCTAVLVCGEFPLETACGNLLNELNAGDGPAWAAGVGSPCPSFFDLRGAFREAERAFREAELWKHPAVLAYRNIHERSFEYAVSYADIEKLHNHLLTGDAEQAYGLLCAMAGRNFPARSQGRQYYHSCRQFYYEILGVFMRIAAHRDLSPILGGLMEYSQKLTPESMLELFRQAIDFTAETLKAERHTPIHDLFTAMIRFIDENHTDNGLSLKMLSREFSLSEPYLSLCFKNEAGINFSSYLENLRLSRAEQMLLESSVPTKKIARQVGYSTANTFYKAFKRKHGVTPSAWLALKRENPDSSEDVRDPAV